MTTTDLYESEALLDQAQKARALRQYTGAAKLYNQALQKREKAVGTDDPSVAHLMDELGTLYMLIGNFTEAEGLFNKALAIVEKAFYAGHAKLAPILEHLADLYIKQEKYTEAEPIAARALEINDKTLSGEHRNTLQSILRLGVVQRKLGKQADAEKTLTKALKNIDTPLGPLEEFKYELAMLFEEQGKTAEAEKAYKEALEGFDYRRSLPRLADCLKSYAAFLKKNNRAKEAEKVLARSAHCRERSKNWHHPDDIFPSTLLRP